MFPWFIHWAPHYPFSGTLRQSVEPHTRWFFDSIRMGAGDGRTEQQIFDAYSYGTQLGWIIDVLLPLISDGQVGNKKNAVRSTKKLIAAYETIEKIKKLNKEINEEALLNGLQSLLNHDEEAFRTLIDKASKLEPEPKP
ncbi:hypothetical protein [Pokkaliibacter plantistimulans]|nr:hypothetical protein [Pokkaliibacter plantistimulans]